MEQAPFKSPSDPPPPLWPEVTTPAQLTPSSLERLPHPPSTVLSSLTGHKPTVCTVVRRSFLNSLIVFPLWLSHCPGGQSPVSQSLSRDRLCSLPSPHWAALAGRAPSTSGTCCCLTSRPLHLPGALPESPFPPCLFLTCQGPAELPPTKNACDPPPPSPLHTVLSSCQKPQLFHIWVPQVGWDSIGPRPWAPRVCGGKEQVKK